AIDLFRMDFYRNRLGVHLYSPIGKKTKRPDQCLLHSKSCRQFRRRGCHCSSGTFLLSILMAACLFFASIFYISFSLFPFPAFPPFKTSCRRNLKFVPYAVHRMNKFVGSEL